MNFKQWEKLLILGLADSISLIAEKRKQNRKKEREGERLGARDRRERNREGGKEEQKKERGGKTYISIPKSLKFKKTTVRLWF